MLARLTATIAAFFLGSAATAEVVTIHAGRLIADAAAGSTGPSTITVENGSIRSVVPGLIPPPQGSRLIDLSQRTVLPGLIDTHVHLTREENHVFWQVPVDTNEWLTLVGVKNAYATVRAGFTTVRDLAGLPNSVTALRRATESGTIPGPRVLSAGSGITTTGGHGDLTGFRPEVLEALDRGHTCTGEHQCAQRVREAARAGADLIKVAVTGGVLSEQARGLEQHFSDQEMEAIVQAAHRLGMKVSAHAHGPRGVEAAARAGVDSIEHGTLADETAIAAMKAQRTVLVPTLLSIVGLRERIGKGIYTPKVEAKAQKSVEAMGRAARAARAAGVPIAFGTDAGVFEHGRNAEEFGLLVQYAGMTPAEALASATTGAAKLLGLEREIGRIAPGYSADIIAVAGNPLTDVRMLERVEFVMARGRVID